MTVLTTLAKNTGLNSEDFSSIAGWMSIACWIVVYSPQIWENYSLKSGEGLSVAFIVLWLAGDLTNLAGGAMAHLLPTLIILAVYRVVRHSYIRSKAASSSATGARFARVTWGIMTLASEPMYCLADSSLQLVLFAAPYIVCDVIILLQVYYYRRQTAKAIESAASETSPLLRERAMSAASLPPPAQPKPLLPAWLEYPLLLVFVLVFGIGAWVVNSYRENGTVSGSHPGAHHGQGQHHGSGHRTDKVELEWKSQVLGWTSALLYFMSRVPQISKNFQTRCAGLSLAMFFFSISGNITFIASILLHSTERTYVIANASWLAGSVSTVFLDVFVLGQFGVYSWQDRQEEAVEV